VRRLAEAGAGVEPWQAAAHRRPRAGPYSAPGQPSTASPGQWPAGARVCRARARQLRRRCRTHMDRSEGPGRAPRHLAALPGFGETKIKALGPSSQSTSAWTSRRTSRRGIRRWETSTPHRRSPPTRRPNARTRPSGTGPGRLRARRRPDDLDAVLRCSTREGLDGRLAPVRKLRSIRHALSRLAVEALQAPRHCHIEKASSR
jgi:hypothetical protein